MSLPHRLTSRRHSTDILLEGAHYTFLFKSQLSGAFIAVRLCRSN